MFKVVRQALPELGKLSLFTPQKKSSSTISFFTTPELRVQRNQLICDKEHIEEQIIKLQVELNKRDSSKANHPELYDDNPYDNIESTAPSP